jgi:hypothetical protein
LSQNTKVNPFETQKASHAYDSLGYTRPGHHTPTNKGNY